MASRLELHEELINILGNRYVYFQPPSSIRMTYPAIVYKVDQVKKMHANDSLYTHTIGYQITVIDEDPDSELFEKMLSFPMTSFIRHYVADNLNHWVFLTYY